MSPGCCHSLSFFKWTVFPDKKLVRYEIWNFFGKYFKWGDCDILHIPHHIQAKKRSIGCSRLRGSRRRGEALSPSMIPRWRLLDCRVEEIEEKERDLRSTEEGEERARAPKALTSGWGSMDCISPTAWRRINFDPSNEFPRRDDSIDHCFIAAK